MARNSADIGFGSEADIACPVRVNGAFAEPLQCREKARLLIAE
jgi:hypothetical protein